ncbi:MAG: hypothetical protein ILO34_04590 [Kiritimatiellae bacterium]|nr:hypothetical protein [Kiritimatiellia bacterium]
MGGRIAFAVFAAVSAVFRVAAESAPFMLSLLQPVQLPDGGRDVGGVRISLVYGGCRNMKGLDLGIAGHCDGDFSGLAVGGVNIVDGRLFGVQAGLVNWNGNGETGSHSIGVQAGLLNNAGDLGGVQYGWINRSSVRMSGLQSGLLNWADDLHGAQLGSYFVLGVNICSGTMQGCQIGLVNWAERIDGGIQIGLLNIVRRNGWLPVLPVINGGF